MSLQSRAAGVVLATILGHLGLSIPETDETPLEREVSRNAEGLLHKTGFMSVGGWVVKVRPRISLRRSQSI